MTRLLIFDWDGTLCDSLARIAQSIEGAALEIGLSPPEEAQVREIVGLGLREALEHLFPGIEHPVLAAVQQSYSRHFVEIDRSPSSFYPSVRETLDICHERGFYLAVATGKSRSGLDRVLRAWGMEKFFHATRCADETASKPDPTMINELLAQFDVQPEEAVMVGDTEFDMEMARRAAVPRIAVTYGAHHVNRLLPYEPLASVTEFSEILNFIKYKVTTNN